VPKQTLFVLALAGDNPTKFIRKSTFVILVFPGYDGYLPSRFVLIGYFEKIEALQDILRESFSKSDHI
jgi:hypothetical protein